MLLGFSATTQFSSPYRLSFLVLFGYTLACAGQFNHRRAELDRPQRVVDRRFPTRPIPLILVMFQISVVVLTVQAFDSFQTLPKQVRSARHYCYSRFIDLCGLPHAPGGLAWISQLRYRSLAAMLFIIIQGGRTCSCHSVSALLKDGAASYPRNLITMLEL